MSLKKNKSTLSKTPRGNAHSRKVHFSLTMREKISENWVAVRKAVKTKKFVRKKNHKKKK